MACIALCYEDQCPVCVCATFPCLTTVVEPLLSKTVVHLYTDTLCYPAQAQETFLFFDASGDGFMDRVS